MAEKITIEIEANAGEVAQQFKDLRSEIARTSDEVDKNSESMRRNGKSGAGTAEAAKELSKTTPALGRVSQSLGRISDSFKNIGKNGGIFGGLSQKLGNLKGSTFLKAGLGGLAAGAIGGFVSSLFGGGSSSKLAPFDRLNSMGETSILDWLMDQLPKLLAPLGLLGAMAGTLTKISNNTNTNPNPQPGSAPGAEESAEEYEEKMGNANRNIWALFTTLAGGAFAEISSRFESLSQLFVEPFAASNRIRAVIDSWFNGALASSISSLFDSILAKASSIGDTIRSWSGGSSGSGSSGSSKQTIEPEIETPGPGSSEEDGGGKSSEKGLLEQIADGLSDAWEGAGQAVADIMNYLPHPINIDRPEGYTSEDGQNVIIDVLSLGVGGLAGKAIGGVVKGAKVIGEWIDDLWKGVGNAFGFAEGGVFMPDRPQLAILGDNKTEPEVAAPYSMIVNAVRDATGSGGGSFGTSSAGQPINITLELDGRTLARMTYDYFKNEERRRNGVGSI